MWYTDTEQNSEPIPGIDDFDPAWFYAKPVQDGLYVIYTTESGGEMSVGDPLVFDDAAAVIRWIRDGGLRDYRRAVMHYGDTEGGGPFVKRVPDLSIVKTDRGQLRWYVSEHEDHELGPDMPYDHAAAVHRWLS